MSDQAIHLQRKARGERPRYFADPAVDKVLSMVMALTGEVAVLRDRLDTIERLLENGQPVTRAAIDGFETDETVKADRDAWRETFLDVVLRSVHQELEAMEAGLDQDSYDKAITATTAS